MGMRFDKSQVFGFSDGVFAFAATLLVLNINTPTLQRAFINNQYSDILQLVITYFITFLIIALYWMQYHRFFNHIKVIDAPLLWLNIFLLMLIAFIPFPLSLLNLQNTHQNAVILYALSLGMVGLMLTIMWIYASMHKNILMVDKIKSITVTYNIIRSSVAPIVFFLSIAISFINLKLAIYFWLVTFFARFLLRPFFKNED